MMEANYTYYIRTFLLIYITFGNYTLEIMSSELHRVVFQSFLLAEGETVQCYGLCNKNLKDASRLNQKFNVSRCEGRKVRFGCNNGYQIKIHIATLGKLKPDLDICTYKKPLDCATDISDKVQITCAAGHRCAIDVSNEYLKSKCGKVKYLAMDIQYLCESKPTTNIPTTIISVSKIPTTTTTKTTLIARKKTTSSKKVVKTIPISIITTTIAETIKPTSTHFTTKDSQAIHNNTIIVSKSSEDSDMFWIISAYIAITNSEFMKKNKTHLALALLLSMFVGMVLCLCFFLDYCRRAKKKRNKNIIESKVSLVPEFQEVDSNEGIELIKPKMVEVITLNGSLQRHKIVSCGDGSYSNNNNDEDESDVYAVSSPFFKRSLEHKLLIHNHIDPNQERPFSPSSLPPPPNHFLVESSSSSSNELLPPPNDFNGDQNHIPCSMVRSSTPTGITTNALLTPQKSIPHDKCNSEMVEVEEVYLAEQNLDDNLECSQYEYVEVAQYHASDEYSSSPQVPRSMTYHRTDNYVVPPKVKFASMNRRATSNEETSQEDTMIRTLDSKRIRKSNPKDRPALHKSKSLDEPKKKTYFTSNGNHYLVRNHRKGRIHVMQRCEESLPPRNCHQKATYSDNEASRRRRRCEMEYKHSCSCHEQGTSLSDLYCTKCGKPEETHLNCCSSLTSNCQSSHDGDNHGPLLSVSNERIKNKQFLVEESGYQSHDTGTDSLCSSTFSTDQEDSRMFLPATLNNDLHNGCRSKNCHNRSQALKRDPKLIIVRGHNKSKVSRRFRRDDYTNAEVHRHDNHTSVDVRPYDSSMDDGSSRDSVKIFRRMRKQNTGDGGLTGLGEDTNCNCIYGIIPSDPMVRVDGIETS